MSEGGAPLVSVVTVFYNRQPLVAASVESLLAQTYPRLEIVVVDDGSSDATLAGLRAYEDDPRVRVVTHENRGFTASIREAVAGTRGEIVAVHGSGDISFPLRIERQVAHLQAHPELGVVACWSDEIHPTGHTTRRQPFLGDDASRALFRANVLSHGTVAFRREVYERIGGYREFFVEAQDYDLWLRLSLRTGIGVLPEVLYQQFQREDGAAASLRRALLQTYEVEFARQCLRMRLTESDDWIDRYGAGAGLLRRRSRELSRLLSSRALDAAARRRDPGAANVFLAASRDEATTLHNLAVGVLLIWVGGGGPLDHLVGGVSSGLGRMRDRIRRIRC